MNEIGRWISANLGWIAIVISIMGTVVVSEISECADLICKRMIIFATKVLGWVTKPEIGRRYKKEWLALLADMPGKFTKVLLTLSMLTRAVPHLWWVLHGQEIPANLVRATTQRLTGWHRARNSPKPGVLVARLDRGHVAFRSRRSNPDVVIIDCEEFQNFLARAKNGEYDLDSLPFAG